MRFTAAAYPYLLGRPALRSTRHPLSAQTQAGHGWTLLLRTGRAVCSKQAGAIVAIPAGITCFDGNPEHSPIASPRQVGHLYGMVPTCVAQHATILTLCNGVSGAAKSNDPRNFDNSAGVMLSYDPQGRTTMTIAVQHVHIKTRDPKQTAQFYIDNFGAGLKGDIPGRGLRVDLHGLQLNITDLIPAQRREQHYGIEHMAVETDDYAATLARLRKNGVRILEELPSDNGRHVCFVECPDGAQMEIIEKV
jgi:catechol 2,3-dioxygenase-like lactoylglutathione lyase family enzyme